MSLRSRVFSRSSHCYFDDSPVGHERNSPYHLSPYERMISLELHRYVRDTRHGGAVHNPLTFRLLMLPRRRRRHITSCVLGGCSPLFMAARDGHLAIVDFLLSQCDADVQQLGEYRVPAASDVVHLVPPLWCAAVAGHLRIVRLLVRHGAHVDCRSDSGSSAVRSACFMSRMGVVQFLVEEAGADIHGANHSGGTCLINAVQSAPLCQLLLNHGAHVNALDVDRKTALHHAVLERQLATCRLLLHHGADPHLMTRSGDDVLQTACLIGDEAIFNMLINQVEYSEERLADSHALLGASLIDERHDVVAALRHWQLSLQLRRTAPPVSPITSTTTTDQHSTHPTAQQVYLGEREFDTVQQLNQLSTDSDRIRIHSLLITERILGWKHKEVHTRLLYRSALYADQLMLRRCIATWLHAAHVASRVASVTHSDSDGGAQLFDQRHFSSHQLVELLLEVVQGERGDEREQERGALCEADVGALFCFIAEQVGVCARLLRVRPQMQAQQRDMDTALFSVVKLLHVLSCLHVRSQAGEDCAWRRSLGHVVAGGHVTSLGHSLLHLAVLPCSRFSESARDIDAEPVTEFPRSAVVRLLTQSGADVDLADHSDRTALMLAATFYHLHPTSLGPAVDVLLEAGSHVDRRRIFTNPFLSSRSSTLLHQDDFAEDTPLGLLTAHGHHVAQHVLRHVTLQCLAARVVRRHVPLDHVPHVFRDWVRQH